MTKVTISKHLLQTIDRVAQYLAPDFMQACEEAGEPASNEDLVEATLDADRLSPAMGAGGDQAAYDELKSLYDRHGYDAVQREVCKHIHLI